MSNVNYKKKYEELLKKEKLFEKERKLLKQALRLTSLGGWYDLRCLSNTNGITYVSNKNSKNFSAMLDFDLFLKNNNSFQLHALAKVIARGDHQNSGVLTYERFVDFFHHLIKIEHIDALKEFDQVCIEEMDEDVELTTLKKYHSLIGVTDFEYDE